MKDWRIGSIDRRQLTLRWLAPFEFRHNWWRVLDPRAWWRAARSRDNWELDWSCHDDVSHRCYCPEGWLCDGRLVVGGFGVIWFYSSYTGELPCPCDQVVIETTWKASDYGKYRRHDCECGGAVCRPLQGPVGVCDRCGKPLADSDFAISDRILDLRRLLTEPDDGV